MEITRSSIDTGKGPADWFTGDVYVDPVGSPSATSRVGGGLVHFAPGARTHWHTHPYGQTIYVTEGVGRCQREGGPAEEIHRATACSSNPDENHWHGAAPNRFMVHIAIQQVDENGSAGTFGDPVTDQQYNGTPAT